MNVTNKDLTPIPILVDIKYSLDKTTVKITAAFGGDAPFRPSRRSQTAQPQWLPTSIDLSKIPKIAKFADLVLNF